LLVAAGRLQDQRQGHMFTQALARLSGPAPRSPVRQLIKERIHQQARLWAQARRSPDPQQGQALQPPSRPAMALYWQALGLSWPADINLPAVAVVTRHIGCLQCAGMENDKGKHGPANN
jgi:hypothetical protein